MNRSLRNLFVSAALVLLTFSHGTRAATWAGFLHNNDIPARDGTLEASLNAAGYSSLLWNRGNTITPAMVSIDSASLTTGIGTSNNAYDWNGIQWAGSNRIPVFGDGDGRGGNYTISITPSGLGKALGSIAVILSTWTDANTGTTVQLTSFTVGGDTTVLNQALYSSFGRATVGQITGLAPAVPIELNFSVLGSYPQPQWYGVSLAFAEIPEPASLSLLALAGLALLRRRR